MQFPTGHNLPRPTRHDVASWAVKLGRFGLAARGFVYIMVGLLAFRTAAGLGGMLTDKQGAVREIERLPFGHVVLWIVAFGLLGYVAWRFAQGFMDLDAHGHDAKAIRKRGAAIGSGLAHTGVATAALALAAGQPGWRIGGSGGDQSGDAAAQDWTAWLMSQPFGQWLVGIVGGIIAGVAIYQFYQAITCKFAKHLRGGGISATQEKWSRRAGRIGYAARGIAFALVSWFLLNAAVHSNPSEAGGLSAAFRALASQAYGGWMLGAVGLGFALFGLYSIIEARFRRIGGG